MTTKTSFSAQEWKRVKDAPLLAGLGISALDFGLVSFAKEMRAVIKEVNAARGSYPTNELIQAVASDLEKKDAGEPVDDGEKRTPEQILGELASIGALVDRKAAPAEAREFKTFLFAVSEKTANASGSGFLGFGAKVSPEERKFLEQLRTRLSLDA
ncbi:MAG: hypothetical protein M3680_25730 [Myxococcota bacterium]|nr:hypothetical protein [Myxococcota bacterium]